MNGDSTHGYTAIDRSFKYFAVTIGKVELSEQELRDMFRQHDKDMSGFIGKEDILCMLLAADKKEQRDPAFRTNLRFLINLIKSADKNGDDKISFEEFKEYITKVVTGVGEEKK